MSIEVIKEGYWLYNGEIKSKVVIEQRDFAAGSGDLEDEPEFRENRFGDFYFVVFFSPLDEQHKTSEVGPFLTKEASFQYCKESTQETIKWL